MNVLDSIVGAYEQASVNLYNNFLFEAQAIFALLVAADFTWSLIGWARKGQGALVTDLGTRLFVVGLFFFLMRVYLSTLGQIPQMFLDTAVQLTGAGAVFDVDSLLRDGVYYGTSVFDKTNILGLFDVSGILIRLFFMIVIFTTFLLIAIRLVFTLVEQQIVVGVGVLLFAFSGSRWTWTIADGFLRYLVNLAIRLVLIVVLLETGKTLAVEWSIQFADNLWVSTEELVSFTAGPIAFAWVVWSLPNRVADTVTQHFHVPSPYAQ